MPTAVVSVAKISDATEGGGNGLFRFTRTDTTDDLWVNFSVGGTATDSVDYTSIGYTVVLPNGIATFDLPVGAFADNEVEGNESVLVEILPSLDYIVDSLDDQATVTITDTTPEVTIATISDATEGGANGLFRFTRTGSTAATLTVDYSINGTATPGDDYSPLSGQITFEVGHSTADVIVAINDDVEIDPDETIDLALVLGDIYAIGGSYYADISISDDEIDSTNWVYWIATSDGDWSDPDNWSTGIVPGPSDVIAFDSYYSDFDCTSLGDNSAGITYAEIHIINNYSGTITLDSDLIIRNLVLSSTDAVIDQPSTTNGTDITVTGAWLWTGGTLNSTNHVSNVDILGTGKIAPVNESTVYLGSTLSFIGAETAPTESTLAAGEIVMINAATNFIIGPYSMLTARTATQGKIIGINFAQRNAQSIMIKPNSALWCIGPGQYESNLPILNQGGRFSLSQMVRANLSGGGAGLDEFDYEQNNTNSEFHIENGSVLNLSNKMSMADGSLYPKMNPNLSAQSQIATINGKFVFTGGTIIFSSPINLGGSLVYGELKINGNVEWTGGTYKPSIDIVTPGKNNKWEIDGKITSAVACVVEPNPLNGTMPATGNAWHILTATETAGQDPSMLDNKYKFISSNVDNERRWSLEGK